MAKISESYKGDYEVIFSLEADPRTDENPSRLLCKRVHIVGPPLIVKCYEKRKKADPVRVIPWERLVSIHEAPAEAEANAAETEPVTKKRGTGPSK